MEFNSAFFISCFLPFSLLLCCVFRGKTANKAVLLIVSLLFYSFGSFQGLILLLATAVINYLLALAIKSCKTPKLICALAVALNLAFLGTYKYLDFLMTSIFGVFGMDWVSIGLAAPIGISFFTFKCISYVVDTYRDPKAGANDFFSFLLYISFFPQVMSGPITRFADFAQQLDSKRCTIEDFAAGFRRFTIGLGKKLILAAAACRVTDAVFALDAQSLDFRLAWLGAIAYSLQIFFDFAGYSDMAIGLGNMLGFRTQENFNYPYIAGSITDFWRRWHISLSSWFRDYLYIPLGGNRKGKSRAALNKLIVFFFCGLWHGSSLNFVIWGLWHGLFSMLESLKIVDTKRLNTNIPGRIISHIYALLVICIGFVFFRAANFAEGWKIVSSMFGAFSISNAATVLLHSIANTENVFCMVLGVVLCTPIAVKVRAFASAHSCKTVYESITFVLTVLLFALCMAEIASGGFTPFIYFQF